MKYQITKGIKAVDGKLTVVYGIKTETVEINDISSNIMDVVKIIRRLVNNKVSDTHIKDVVEDFLCTLE